MFLRWIKIDTVAKKKTQFKKNGKNFSWMVKKIKGQRANKELQQKSIESKRVL